MPLQQPVAGLLAACQMGKDVGKWRNRLLQHACVIGQGQLGAFAEGVVQGGVGVAAAVCLHQRMEVGQCGRVLQHGLVKRLPGGFDGRAVVFQQFVIGRQLQLLHNLQGRSAQQRGKPAVKGADLHRPAMLQQPQIQALQGGRVLLCFDRSHATGLQFLRQCG